MATTEDIIESIARRLSEGGYKVSREVTLPNGPTAKIAASKTYFSWKGLVILSQHIVVQQLDKAKTQDIQALFESGFRFGKHANWIPLLRGMQFGYMIIPVIVGANPDGALVQYVSSSPRKHWSLFEYPVFVDSHNSETFSFQGTAVWGAFFFSDLRKVIEKYITSLPTKASDR
ncbi:MAG TPA: hypothetical protein VK812_06440 [Candidatus Binatus sp.]|jgi:hypothetical protein|nr:hypothetical protein [Candidatus Binatus sp.]